MENNTILKNLYYELKRRNNLDNNISDCSRIQREIINLLLPDEGKTDFEKLYMEFINLPKPKSSHDKNTLKMLNINDEFLKYLENRLFEE